MYKNRNIQKSLIQIYAIVLKNHFPPNILIQAKYNMFTVNLQVVLDIMRYIDNIQMENNSRP